MAQKRKLFKEGKSGQVKYISCYSWPNEILGLVKNIFGGLGFQINT